MRVGGFIIAKKRPRYFRNLAVFSVLALSLGLMIALGGLSIIQAYSLAYPVHQPPDSALLDLLEINNWENAVFTTQDGLRLEGWYIPPSPNTDGASLIFIHGHGSNRAHFLGELPIFLDAGYGVLLFDSRNHGMSEGRVTTMGLLEVQDVQAAFAWLIEQPEVNPERIGLYGASMGGATAILAMAEIPQARVLLVDGGYAAFSDVVAEGVRNVSGLPRFPFGDLIIQWTGLQSGENLYAVRSIDVIADITARPIFIMHGSSDPTIPVTHAERLYAAADEPKVLYIVPNGGHGGLMQRNPAEYKQRVLAFLATYLRGD
ncbi:MAG: alpha/beta fold hydrolase [Chitinophagaceae bacterium]|nr:alpha/beta fold hydrolase [Anaerolineae bacterium]